MRLRFTWCDHPDNYADGLTDTNGLFAAERVSMSDCRWRIEKEGYYRTEGRHSFMANLSNASVKDGRWQPWNPTVKVTLKEKRNPIPLFAKTVTFDIQRGNTVGFDCQKGALVQPQGTGTVSDIYFHFESESDKLCFFVTNRLDCFVGDGDGLQVITQDETSGLRSTYEAPAEGYTKCTTFSLKRTDTKVYENVELKKNEYMVFMSSRRPYIDQDEIKSKSFFFGKIYSLEYGENIDRPNFGLVRFSCYFNPTPNDRNLEFDGKTNLFRPKWSDTDWPREP